MNADVRTLKKVISDVSVDSDGFPSMLEKATVVASNCKRAEASEFGTGRKLGARTSSSAFEESVQKRRLKLSLGFATRDEAPLEKEPDKKVVLKRPAAKVSKAKGKGGVVKSVSPLQKWVKLQKAVAYKGNIRAYIMGSLAKGQPCRLIVGCSVKQSSQYMWIIDHIMDMMQQKGLSKEEAVQLREKLIVEWP